VDTFSYTVSDGIGGTSTASVTVTVGAPPSNSSPDAVNDARSTSVNTAVVIPVLDNDSDLDSDTLNVTNVTQGSNGSVSINSDNTVTYTPNTGFTGNDSFTYTISDGNGGTDSASVNVNVSTGNGPYLGYEVGTSIYAVDKNDPTNQLSDLLESRYTLYSVGIGVCFGEFGSNSITLSTCAKLISKSSEYSDFTSSST